MLKVSQLTKSYGKAPVLRNLSFEIMSGEVYGFLGANGAGKTTAINIICGQLRADSGTVLLNNKHIDTHARHHFGVAPQEIALYPHLSCVQNLMFLGSLYGLHGKKLRQRIDSLIAMISLSSHAHKRITTLSGGMKRRMNMAAALMHDPQLIILDEPTVGLDIEVRHEIWNIIHTLKQHNKCVLLTTHNMEEAEHLSTRIGILAQGKILAEGTMEEMKKYIPAVELAIIETDNEAGVIKVAEQQHIAYRKYKNQLAVLLPQKMSIADVTNLFKTVDIRSVSLKNITLEYVYLELLQAA